MHVKILSKKPLKIIFPFLLAAALLIVMLCHLLKKDAEERDRVYAGLITINEICIANTGTEVSGSVIYEDYIELYNPTDETLSLEGLYISDDADNLPGEALPDEEIEPHGYCIIYAVGEDGSVPEGCIGVSFKLSAGESVYLSYIPPDVEENLENEEAVPSKSDIEIFSVVSIPEDAVTDAVYAALEDGGDEYAWMRSSPGASNADSSIVLDEPAILADSGFYEDYVTVEISAEEGLEIRYTLDGSEPDESSVLYTGPIVLTDPSRNENVYSSRTDIAAEADGYAAPADLVDKVHVLKAAVFDSYGNSSNIVTATYMIDIEDRDGYGDSLILSISTEPDNLFSDEGIYVRGSLYEDALEEGIINSELPWIELMHYTNYYVDGMESERDAFIQLFSGDGELLLDQACGIRVRGGESRSFPQKSFTLFARARYGDSTFDTDIFGEEIGYSSLIVNQGQRFRKVFFFSLVEDRSAAVQHYVPCQVFLDGEYWGMYYLMENYSAEYINAYYGVGEEDVLIINDSEYVQEGTDADIQYFNDLMDFLETGDFSDDEVYEELLEMMDMQSFIDWMCTNIYIGNTDTKPLDGNVMTWRSLEEDGTGYGDGRWRWMLYDLDDALAAGTDYEGENAYAFDSFGGFASYSSEGFIDSEPMPALMENEDFCEQFVITFMDMANENFNADRVLALLDEMEEEYASWADLGYERWNTSEMFDSFKDQIEDLRVFFSKRYDVIVPLLAEYFELEGDLADVTLELDGGDGGEVTLNTITPDLSEGSWSGSYYTDYTVTLSVDVDKGYEFEGWEVYGGSLVSGSTSDETIEIRLEEDAYIRAVFEVD